MTRRRFAKNLVVFVGLLLFLLAVCLLSLKIGAVPLSFSRLFSVLHKHFFNLPEDSTLAGIVLRLRLPRIILALLVGGGLSVAGVLFQGLFRNPLVEPYTLGVSGGAALGVSLGLLLGPALPGSCFPLFGFAGAWAAVLLAYSIARRRRLLKVSYLLLVGVMLSFISSALIMLLMSVSNLSEFRTIVFWAMGSLQNADPGMLRIVTPLILIGVILSFSRAWVLNALVLGEEGAAHLGIKLEREKGRLFFLGALLSGTAVSVAGVIGFVGLVVPHFTRLLVGPDHRLLLPASFLAGGAFLILCDALARTLLAPAELPVGVITGVLGGSVFIYFLSRNKK
jgi:iron complex transport system permease protein